MDYTLLKLTLGVIATIGLYSVLYRETKVYRFFEHMFVGLATGWSLTALWTELLKENWWDPMVGRLAEDGSPAVDGNFAWIFLLPIGLMAYFVFSKKHNWMSRIPIGIILGLWSGQQVQVWWNRYGPQMLNSMKPIFPSTTESWTVPDTTGLSPERIAEINQQTYPSEAINNLIFLFTLIAVLSYFFFSFDIKSKALMGLNRWGRWLLMVGFGAIFGTTIMMRFTLLIDRMGFVWIEWLRDGVLRRLGGG
jgi:hypothetical protein